MSGAPLTLSPAARVKEPDAPPDEAETDPDLAPVAWMAAHHGARFTPAAVRARLPARADLAQPAMLARALAAIGLQSRLVLRKLSAVDPATLPAILFTKAGAPLILLGFSSDGRIARIADPQAALAEQEEPARKLARRITRDVMLVAPDTPGAQGGYAPRHRDTARNWFWGALLANRGAWVQVFVAAFAINTLGLALPLFVMNVYDRVIPNLAFVTLWTLAIGVGIALLLDLALRGVRARILETLGRRLDTGIAATLFAHTLSLRPSARPDGAAVLAHQIRDLETVREFFGSASFVSLIDLLFIGVFLWVLWLIVGPLALVPLIAVPVTIALALVAQWPMGRIAAEAQQTAGQRQAVLHDALQGHETLKTLNAEPVMQRAWERASASAARINGKSRFWATVAGSGTQLVQQAVSVAIIVWGVFLVAEGQITIGALIAANILAGRALAPMGAIAQTIFRARYAGRALRTLSALMDTEPERSATVKSAARVTRGAVRLDGVSYRYPGADRDAIADLSLQIAPGERVAILGRVGSGKSSLGRLICGLLPPDSGTVLIDGQAAGQYDPAELRAGIGFLPQDPELFTGSLRDNLLMGAPRATDAEIAAALQTAGLADFVATHPAGLARFVGERGRHLSGGQRQGLALARLLLCRPKTLFLDEPTNAMDREMEAQVTERLRALSDAGTGLILCTHRPQLAALASRWIVLDQGRIMLDGNREMVTAKLGGASRGAG